MNVIASWGIIVLVSLHIKALISAQHIEVWKSLALQLQMIDEGGNVFIIVWLSKSRRRRCLINSLYLRYLPFSIPHSFRLPFAKDGDYDL